MRPDVLDAIKERPTLENYARFLSIDHEMIRSDREMALLNRQREIAAQNQRALQLHHLVQQLKGSEADSNNNEPDQESEG